MVSKEKCLKCGCCVAVCPMGAITFGEDGYPIIDKTLCVKCGACQNSCPAEAIKIE